MNEAYPSTSHASSPKYLRLRSIPTEATKPAFLPNLTPVTRPVWSKEKEIGERSIFALWEGLFGRSFGTVKGTRAYVNKFEEGMLKLTEEMDNSTAYT